MSRRGPSDGYDFGRKRDYRRKVWATFRDQLKLQGAVIADAHVALMPSYEGAEIEVALDAGFREWNMHVIDANPAIVATLKRKYRRINTYGVTASAAMLRMNSEGVRLACANFDFCGQLSKKYMDELSDISRTGSLGSATTWSRTAFGVFADKALVAFNMLRGRESANAKVLTEDCLNESALIDAVGPALSSHQGFDEVLSRMLAPVAGLKVRDRQRIFCLQQALNLTHLIEPDLACRMVKHLAGKAIPWYPLPIPKLVRAETYVSVNGQSMLWSVWFVESVKSLNAELEDMRSHAYA